MYPKHRYINNEIYRLLVDKRCAIVCDLEPEVPYPSYPTQDQVIDWLEQEYKIFISSFPLFKLETLYSGCKRLQGGYGVDIKDEKGIEYGCQKNYKTKKEAINAALLKVLNELI